MSEISDKALEAFTEYFVRNYPGPDTVIFDPKWHAPKIFNAAKAALNSSDLTQELDRLREENERLRKALERAKPYVDRAVQKASQAGAPSMADILVPGIICAALSPDNSTQKKEG